MGMNENQDIRIMAEDYKWLWMFGIKKSKVEDMLLKSEVIECIDEAFGCAHIAFQDLRRTLHGFGKWGRTDKDEFRENISKQIIGNIATLFVLRLEVSDDDFIAAEQERFDSWHHHACKCVEDAAQEYPEITNGFYYGSAQKWLNMTLKNMLALDKWPELNRIAQYLHIPVDNIVINQAKKDLKIIWSNKQWDNKTWSKLNFEQYYSYQKCLRKAIMEKQSFPIKWELMI